MFNLKTLTAGATALTMMASATFAETVIRVQSVLGNSSDEVRMVESFAQDVFDLTNGSVKIEILPPGAVVGPRDIIDAVDAGLVEVASHGHTTGVVSTQRRTYLGHQSLARASA